MGMVEMNCCNLGLLSSSSSSSTLSSVVSFNSNSSVKFMRSSKHIIIIRLSKTTRKIRALQSDQTANNASTSLHQQPPQVNFAFVSSVLLPDGNMDIRCRTATGGQKLRDIMLDANVELYGPYARPLLNCAGGGICGTCIVEVVQGKELLSPRTEIEKEKLKKNPKNWRLACQTTVGKPDSTGLVMIQQLPEWKVHEWSYGKPPTPSSQEQEEILNEES